MRDSTCPFPPPLQKSSIILCIKIIICSQRTWFSFLRGIFFEMNLNISGHIMGWFRACFRAIDARRTCDNWHGSRVPMCSYIQLLRGFYVGFDFRHQFKSCTKFSNLLFYFQIKVLNFVKVKILINRLWTSGSYLNTEYIDTKLIPLHAYLTSRFCTTKKTKKDSLKWMKGQNDKLNDLNMD